MKSTGIIISAMCAICMAITLLPAATFAATFSADGAGGTANLTATADPATTAADAADAARSSSAAAPEMTRAAGGELTTNAESTNSAELMTSAELAAASQNGWVTDEAQDRYYYVDGIPVTGLQSIDGSWYYFNEAGVMQTGAITVDGIRYYFQTAGEAEGIMWTKAGWKTLDGKRYYFRQQANGTVCMNLGWLKIDNKTWYCDPKTGEQVTGWKKINGKKYYFRETDSKKGRMVTGLKTINGVRYYFNAKGVMKTGAVKYEGKLYYFKNSGKSVMKTGWFKGSDKKKRYSLGKARVAVGTQKISGIWYSFSASSGVLLRKIGDDVDKKIQPYTSSTRYMIIVRLSEHKVRVYSGGKNKWNRIHTFRCTTGASSTPTVRGTFSVGAKGRYFNTGTSARCWYYTQFHGNYLFHSVIYDRSASPRHVVDGRLGISASHGCVRLALSNAKWIYNNIPRGTKVVIY